MKTHFPPFLLLLLFLLTLFTTTHSQTPPNFKCNTTSKCHALIDYPSPNTTTISSIQTLFSIRNLRSLLGANNLPLSTSPNSSITAGQTLKIPFPCLCRNGTGLSNKRPKYTVKSGDTLYIIATEVFKVSVAFQEIGKVNNITNLDEIEVGDELWIPLPCSCDEVGGKVVHYGHVVKPGSSLSLIASEFGTSEDSIRGLNDGVNFANLMAGQVLDVPLKACDSSVKNYSLDYPLLVANGTYVFTANNCIKCTCNSANNWTLQCEPSGLNSSCPSAQCAGSDNLYIGNSTTSGCNRTTCAYEGYSNNRTIFTTLITDNTCATGSPAGSGSFSLTAYSSWSIVLMFIHLILLGLYLH